MDGRGGSYLERRLDELARLPADDERRWLIAARGAGAAQALEWAGLLDAGDHHRWMAEFSAVASGRGRRSPGPPHPTHAEHELVRAARDRLDRGEAQQLPPEPVWRPERYLLCDPDAGDPAVNLIEIRPGGITFRIHHTSEAQFVPRGTDSPTEPFFTVSDDVGTSYRCGINQSGAIVTCNAWPAPPPTARQLRLGSAAGDARDFDLAESRPGHTDVTIEYLDEGDARLIGPDVAVERFVLAAGATNQFPLVYAESGLDALGELGLLGADERDRALARVRDAGADGRPAMTRPQRLLYTEPPEWPGVRVGGGILFDDAVSIRWGQLPPEYRLGGPEPWLLLDYDWGLVEWALTDDLGTVYHPTNMSAGHGGFFTYPYWNGEQVFVPRVPDHATQLRMTMRHRTAVISLEPQRRE